VSRDTDSYPKISSLNKKRQLRSRKFTWTSLALKKCTGNLLFVCSNKELDWMQYSLPHTHENRSRQQFLELCVCDVSTGK